MPRPSALLSTYLLTAALLLAGCSSVTSEHPIGSPVKDTSRVDLTGVWHVGDRSFHVVQRDNGKIHVAMPEWKDGQFKLQQQEMLLTEEDDAYYLHGVQHKDDPSKQRFTLVRIIPRGIDHDTVVIMPAKPAHFAEAVESGELPGTVNRSGNRTRVHLTAEPDVLDRYIDRDRAAEQFNVDAPAVAKRIGKLDPDKN